jgi:hypothetical protein
MCRTFINLKMHISIQIADYLLQPCDMDLQFNRMVQFSLLVKAGGRLREFNFRKLRNPENEMFTVNVCDERGERHFFDLRKEEKNWHIPQTNLPPWITQSEPTIQQAVEEELKNW